MTPLNSSQKLLSNNKPQTSLGRLYSNRNKVLAVLECPEAKPLLEFLQEWLKDEVSGSRSMKELSDIKVSQGKQLVLERILGLRTEMKEYAKKQLDKQLGGG